MILGDELGQMLKANTFLQEFALPAEKIKYYSAFLYGYVGSRRVQRGVQSSHIILYK